jgi:hypothetical protein
MAAFCSCFDRPKNAKPLKKIPPSAFTFSSVCCCCCTTQNEKGNKEENIELIPDKISDNLNMSDQIDF